MYLNIIIGIVGTLMVLEGLIILISPSVTKSWMRSMIRSYSRWKWFGFIEFIVGILLFLVAITTKAS